MITQEKLKQLLHYNPETGVFTRKATTSSRSVAGSIAGCIDWHGYRLVFIEGARYGAHRLAWLYMTGSWPAEQVDHKNGIRSDNQWDNLREATNAQNCQNSATYKSNTSGFKGVTWDSSRGKWKAQIAVNGKQKIIGRFADKVVAHQAYLTAKSELHTFNPVPREEQSCH